MSGVSKVDPKARAKEAAKTRKMAPERKEAYKKEKAKKQLVAEWELTPKMTGKPITRFYRRAIKSSLS